MTIGKIANQDLTIRDIPPTGASYDEIIEFALTYDGYEAFGGFEALSALANSRTHRTLDEARGCLFFEQRRYRHFGEDPDEESMAYIETLLDFIRHNVCECDGRN